MHINNSKYTTEMREQTAAYIIENHKSATSMEEEMRIDARLATQSRCEKI